MIAYRFKTTIPHDHTVIVPADVPAGEAEIVIFVSEAGPAQSVLADSDDLLRKILEIAASIPEDELALVPTDAAVNLDHYLYGAPHRPRERD